MTLTRRGSALKKHQARRVWLTPDLHLYDGVPGIKDDVTDANREALDLLCGAMEAARLFGQKSREQNRETVRRLLSELRGEDVGRGGW